MSDLHAMIDIETLATSEDAAILWIAGVRFTMDEELKALDYSTVTRVNGMYDQCYLMRPSLTSNMELGRHIDHKTLRWWLDMERVEEQPRAPLFKELIAPTDLSLQQALSTLRSWLSPVKYVWSNGNNFDLKLLAHAYNQINQDQPWGYKYERDCRTLWHITGRHQPKQDVKHHPLYDAWTQAQAVQYSWEKLCGPIDSD